MSTSEPSPAELLDRCLSASPTELNQFLGNADEDLFVALGDEAERLAFADVARALQAAELVVQVADQRAGPRAQARARRALAQALAYAGRHEESLAACQAAITAAGTAAPIEAGRARVASLHPLNELGRYDEAIAAGEQAHEILTAAGEPALAARADLNLGGIHQNRGAPARALFHFDRAAPALADEPLMTGYLQNNRGETLLTLNDFTGAEDCFHAAMTASEAAGAAVIAAIAQGNLADLETRRGRLSAALYHFEHARRRLEHDTAQSHVARLLGEEAEALESLGLPEDALRTYQAALDALERLGLAAECARTRAGLGRTLLRLGRAAEADPILQAAGEAFTTLGHAPAAARVALTRCDAALARNDVTEATRLVDAARPVLATDPLDRIALLDQVARIQRSAGDPGGAGATLSVALEQSRAFDIAPLSADLLHRRGHCHLASGATLDALRDFEDAAMQKERIRGALQAERLRSALTADAGDLYQDLLDTHVSAEDPDLAALFRAVELAQSRTLLDRVAGAGADQAASSASAGPLEQRRIVLRNELSVLFSRLAEAHHAGRRTLDLPAWQNQVAERQRELHKVEQRLASATLDIAQPGPVDLDQFQRALDPDAAAIVFFASRGNLHALAVTRERTRLLRQLAPLSEIQQRLETLQFQLQRALRPGPTNGRRAGRLLADVRAELGWFHEQIVANWLPAVGDRRRLTIVPHGVLHALPLHAAWDGQQHMIERYAVSYAPSASVLTRLAGRGAATARRGALIVGVPDDYAPDIADEAAEIAAATGGECLVGPAATVAAVLAGMPGKRSIHLACHGFFDPANPEASGLRLHDRWLAGHDFADLTLTADLVTLSGCNTGRHALRAGQELVGLARGFLGAGAAHVLVTLWAAHDQKTRRLMRDFHTMWSAGPDAGNCASALAAVTRDFMKEEPHPCFWAPFILIGTS